MFSKKKSISDEAFIPKPARMMAIAQLCIAFTVLLIVLGYPFMGKHYTLKSRLLVYDAVIQDPRFESLSPAIQEGLNQEKSSIVAQMGSSFLAKLATSYTKFAQIPKFKKLWLVLSIVLPILILLKIEGAARAAWVLPLLALAFALDNSRYGMRASPNADEQLYPSEQILETQYLGRKLSSNILEQKGDLLLGWHLYLIKDWAGEVPDTDPEIFKQQVKKGEFAFNLERAIRHANIALQDSVGRKESSILLFLYILWNTFFAYFINKKKWELG